MWGQPPRLACPERSRRVERSLTISPSRRVPHHDKGVPHPLRFLQRVGTTDLSAFWVAQRFSAAIRPSDERGL